MFAAFSGLSEGRTGGAGEELLGTLAFGMTGAIMAVRGGGGPTAGLLAAGGVGEDVFEVPLAPFCGGGVTVEGVFEGGAAGAGVVAANGCEIGGGVGFSGVLAVTFAPCM